MRYKVGDCVNYTNRLCKSHKGFVFFTQKCIFVRNTQKSCYFLTIVLFKIHNMGKNITVGEGYTERVKTDHRNGTQTVVQENVEVRPVMDGFHNETVRDRYRFGRDFITMFTEDLFDLVVDGKMSLREWKVFLLLCATMNTKNITVTNLEAISETLKMEKADVSRTITKLKKRKLIVENRWIRSESGRGSRTRVFQLAIGEKLEQMNYNIAYNGEIKHYRKIRSDHPQITSIDGESLLNPNAEAQRQKLLREQRQKESLFPEFFQEEEEVSPDVQDPQVDPDTGELFQ